MIKVIIIDDETLARNYMVNLIDWEHNGFDLIGSYSDAHQAMNAFRKYHPDLIITDIYMPGTSGLEMVNEIREVDKKTHIIFISAYKNFEYAKQAIHLKSDEYILKDELDGDTFLKKLIAIKNTIDREKESTKYTLSSILEEIFTKNIKEDKYQKIISEDEYIKLGKKYMYVVLSQRGEPDFVREILHISNDELLEDDNKLSKTFDLSAINNGLNVTSWFRISTHNILIILEDNDNMVSNQHQREILQSFCKELQSELSDNNYLYNIHYLSRKMIVQDFSTYYAEKRGEIIADDMECDNPIIDFDSIVESNTHINETNINEDDVAEALKNHDRVKFNEYIDILNRSRKYRDYITFYWYIKALLMAEKRFDGKLMDNISQRTFSIVENSRSYNLKTADGLVQFIEDKAREIINSKNEEQKYSESILKTIEYLKNNFTDPDCTLKKVATEVNLSASWLSTKFKEEVKIGINEYICNLRIDKAKHILENSDVMAYEVSEAVGFTSSQYFSRVFKELVGVTPNRYRKEHREQ